MTLKQAIRDQLTESLSKLGVKEITPSVEYPPDLSQGDYATNVAFTVAKQLKISPMEAGEKIIEKFTVQSSRFKVALALPGFINFSIANKDLLTAVDSLDEKDLQAFAGKKVMVEFTDPNPFKEFHIGHLYSNVVGESICRLLETNGAELRRVTYQSDVGMHVAMAIWGMKTKLKAKSETSPAHSRLSTEAYPSESKTGRQERKGEGDELVGSPLEKGELEGIISQKIQDLEAAPLQERMKLLGEAYALGASAYKDDEAAKREIVGLNKEIYQIVNDGPRTQNIVSLLYAKGKQWSLAYFEKIYARLGTTFIKNYFESVAGPIGLALVKQHIADGTFEESEGAVVFPKEKSGLHTRVFINSQALPTYEAKELGLAPTKYKDFPYDLSIIITGNEINEYFKVLLKALSFISPDLAAKTKHLSHGMVRLPEGKMSSRTGNVLTGEWLLEATKAKIKEQYPDMKTETLEQVTVSAVKYALLKSSLGHDTEFSFKESISFDGNSGPYLQYTYARTQSVLAKISDTKILPHPPLIKEGTGTYLPLDKGGWGDLQLGIEERTLLVLLSRFPEIVEEATRKFAPNILCTYLFDLAQAFNLFYQKYPILKADEQEREFRLFLTEKTGEVIKRGLSLLGIQAPERM